MEVVRIEANDSELLNPGFDGWASAGKHNIALIPTPLNGNPAIKAISPFIEKSTDHGSINQLTVSTAHNGNLLAVRLSWNSDKHNEINDLDQFVDGAAVMFPLTDKASAFTMGSPSDPVNAWYWKANLATEGLDVVARGYGTSARHQDHRMPIQCRAMHDGKAWHVVLARVLAGVAGRVAFQPGQPTRMAFALWDGGNRERSGRKSFSGDFVAVALAR